MTSLHIISIGFVLLLSVWKCISNSLLICCFVRNKKNISSYTLNIFFLTINALMQGLFGLLAAGIGISAVLVGVSPTWCSMVMTVFFACITCETLQTLYMFVQWSSAFCVLQYKHSQRCISAVHTVLFIASFVLMCVPFSMWTESDDVTQIVRVCNASVLVNPLQGLGYFACVTGLPGLISIVIYVSLQVQLKWKMRKVYPNQAIHQNENGHELNTIPVSEVQPEVPTKAKKQKYETHKKALKTLAFFLLTNTSLPVQYLVVWLVFYQNPDVVAVRYVHSVSFMLLYFNTSFNIFVIIKRYEIFKDDVKKMLQAFTDCFCDG